MTPKGPAKLAKYLERTGLRQTALAAHLGISDAHLSLLLSHKRRPSLRVAARIERQCGIAPKDFAA